jgi:predicted metal-dependent hydrolase
MEMERTIQQMLQQILANKAEMKVDRKTHQARMEANKEDMLAEISASMKSNEDWLARLESRIETKMDGNQAEMRSTVCAMRSELKKTFQHGRKVVIQHIGSEMDETTAC